MRIQPRTLLKGLGIFVVLVIGLLVTIPWFFKDEIIAELKRTANARLNATVDFSDASVSLLRHFPDLSLTIRDLSITGKGTFERIPLARIDALRLRLDLLSVLSSSRPLTIEGVALKRPDLHVIVLSDGQANYDIMLPDTAATTETDAAAPFVIELRGYGIDDGRLVYEDHQSDLRVAATGLNHRGSGRFTESVFDLSTQTAIDTLTLISGGIAWLDEARLALDATLGVDLDRMRFELKDNKLQLNALTLEGEGWIAMPDEQIDMDLALRAPDNSFAALFSLVPGAFIEGYERVQAGGTFNFAASAKGTYSADTWPALDLQLEARDGSIQYPGMPLAIEGVRTSTRITHPGGAPDLLVVDIRDLAMKVGESTLSGKFVLRRPLSDPDLDAALKAKLDLAEWARAFPMEGIQKLEGAIAADLVARARLSQLEQNRLDQVDMRGTFRIKQLQWAAADMPPIAIEVLDGRLQPDTLQIKNFVSTLGNSDLRGNATFRNLLGWFAEGRKMTGTVALQSDNFDVNEWLTDSEAEATPAATTAETSMPPENWAFDFDVRFQRLRYDLYVLTDLQAGGTIAPQRLDIRSASGRLGSSDFAASGQLTNLMNFVNYNEPLRGHLDLSGTFMDYADLVPEGEASSTAAPATATAVPDFRYDITFSGKIGQFKYDPWLLTSLTGAGRITEKAITIDRFATRMGRSDLAGHGVIRNYLEYVYRNEPVKGELVLESNLLDADELMGTEEETASAGTTTEESGVYAVPKAFEFDILTRFGQLVYSGIPLYNVSGKLAMTGGELLFEDFTADALGGQMGLSGKYSTADPEQPAFAIKYELKNLLFQEAFRKVATFRALAPIAQFIEGKFNSSVILEGLLGPDMFPLLGTLDAQGFLEAVDAMIKGYPPLEQVSEQLNVPFFRQVPLDEVEAWFEVQDGTVELKPVSYAWEDIRMDVKGKHRLDGAMDYEIVARIPRARFEANPAGARAAAGLDWLQQQATALGLPFEQGEVVKLRIGLSGTIKQPRVSVKLLGFEGKSAVASAKEQARQQAEEVIEEKKSELVGEAEARRDTLVQQAKQEAAKVADSVKTQVEQKAEDIASQAKKKAGEEVGKKVEEVVGEGAKKEVEEIKGKLEKWNPFGNKKKGGNEE